MALRTIRNSLTDRPVSAWLDSSDFASLQRHPVYGGFGRSYYPAVTDTPPADCSLAVLDDNRPVLLVPAVIESGRLSFHGMPLRVFLRDDVSAALVAEATRTAVDEIEAIAADRALADVAIIEPAASPLSPLSEACLARQYRPEMKLHGSCNLALDEAGRRKSLRKSFRSLINWGQRNLTLKYVNRDTPDASLFGEFQDFHRMVAGRVTRPQASWDVMLAWIANGGGELSLAYLESGELVAGNLVVDGTTTSYYASGVYDRERFDKPMAHWPLWNAIGRARERGMTEFDLGELPFQHDSNAKEYAIGYFKRGFATHINSSTLWRRNHADSSLQRGA